MDLSKLKSLSDDYIRAREELTEAKLVTSAKQAMVNELEGAICACMEAAELWRFDTEKASLTRIARPSVRIPKIPEHRNAFFNYLREQGIFEQMVSVHSNTLNAFVKAENDAALARGEIDFRIPGLEIGEYEYLQVRNK